MQQECERDLLGVDESTEEERERRREKLRKRDEENPLEAASWLKPEDKHEFHEEIDAIPTRLAIVNWLPGRSGGPA